MLIQRLIFPDKPKPSVTNSIYPFARPGIERFLKGKSIKLIEIFVVVVVDNTFEVVLHRGHSGLGLSLTGGLAENKPIEIAEIYAKEPAALSGRFHVGDIILSINDVLLYNKNVRVCLMRQCLFFYHN